MINSCLGRSFTEEWFGISVFDCDEFFFCMCNCSVSGSDCSMIGSDCSIAPFKGFVLSSNVLTRWAVILFRGGMNWIVQLQIVIGDQVVVDD